MLPVIIGGAAAVGTGLYLIYSGKKPAAVKAAPPKTATPAPTAPAAPPNTLPSPIGPIPTTIWGAPSTTVPPVSVTPAGWPVQGTGAAVAQNSPAFHAASALYDYMHLNGQDKSPTMIGLLKAFQSAGNADPTVQFGKDMTVNGVYDLPTCAALTVLMGDPIPPDTTGQPDVRFYTMPFSFLSDITKTGVSQLSASNLNAYLRLHGDDKSPIDVLLIRQFQHDANNDVKFPSGKLPSKLTEDGKWGPKTKAALAVYNYSPI